MVFQYVNSVELYYFDARYNILFSTMFQWYENVENVHFNSRYQFFPNTKFIGRVKTWKLWWTNLAVKPQALNKLSGNIRVWYWVMNSHRLCCRLMVCKSTTLNTGLLFCYSNLRIRFFSLCWVFFYASAFSYLKKAQKNKIHIAEQLWGNLVYFLHTCTSFIVFLLFAFDRRHLLQLDSC